MNTDSEMETNSQYQQKQHPCNCPVCKGQCIRCNSIGCGMCPFCKNTRCPICPQCAEVLEGYNMEDIKETKNKFIKSLTFEKVTLTLILILVIYIAWKHYKE